MSHFTCFPRLYKINTQIQLCIFLFLKFKLVWHWYNFDKIWQFKSYTLSTCKNYICLCGKETTTRPVGSTFPTRWWAISTQYFWLYGIYKQVCMFIHMYKEVCKYITGICSYTLLCWRMQSTHIIFIYGISHFWENLLNLCALCQIKTK